MITLFVRTKSTSKPSRIIFTSPCHLKLRRRYRSSNMWAVDALCPREVRGPQSKRKSSQVSMEAAPLWTSWAVLRCTVERRTYTPRIVSTRKSRIMTYFRARTTAQLPILNDMISVRKVGRFMRDFLAMTLRQRGQWCTTSLKAGHRSGRTQKAIQPRLNHTTKPRTQVTHEASWSMKVITERSQCGQEQCSGMSPKIFPSFLSSWT
mmetsp:Transcript_41525/g.123253  ORF Transcript_41525/g.123253 Transcript_41525/m.123253 type:complete len:207 (-) Transcript_41525:207-827(-)